MSTGGSRRGIFREFKRRPRCRQQGLEEEFRVRGNLQDGRDVERSFWKRSVKGFKRATEMLPGTSRRGA